MNEILNAAHANNLDEIILPKSILNDIYLLLSLSGVDTSDVNYVCFAKERCQYPLHGMFPSYRCTETDVEYLGYKVTLVE
jgi:hypothetical protein